MILTLLKVLLLVVVLAVAAFVFVKFRDVRFLLRGIAILVTTNRAAAKNFTFSHKWAETVKQYRHKVAMIDAESGKKYTFQQLDELSNKFAHFYLSQGVTAGDKVGIYMTSRIEFFTTWLGAAKIGARAALINFNLADKALAHALTICSCKVAIVEASLAANFQTALPLLTEEERSALSIFTFDGAYAAVGESVDPILAGTTTEAVPAAQGPLAAGVRLADALLYVYTSGTTGLPKAAIVTHYRLRSMGTGFGWMFSVKSSDVIYTPLPLYHSAANIGVSMGVERGCTVVVRSAFSARAFFPDAVKYNVTIVQYIGQLCRYLLKTPPNPAADKKHRIRLALGNGLRPDVWKPFQNRFNIPQIGEFYAATEGAGALLNTENKPGCVGFISPLVSKIFPSKIVCFDRELGAIKRGADGFAIPCQPDEAGEYISEILVKKHGIRTFDGYVNKKATARKIYRDVFRKGDAWFASGDLLRKDSEGFVTFVDRCGDTFRWKGENCSTNEVEEALSAAIADSAPDATVNVYGVLVPGCDGRACMAATRSAQPLDLAALAAAAKQSLPAYARPLFLRVLPSGGMALTVTFKLKKTALRDEGFNPSQIADPLYFFNGTEYVPLDAALYDRIVAGDVRL